MREDGSFFKNQTLGRNAGQHTLLGMFGDDKEDNVIIKRPMNLKNENLRYEVMKPTFKTPAKPTIQFDNDKGETRLTIWPRREQS